MKISVYFINGAIGSVRLEDLDELLEKKVIVGFLRSSGWAMVGRDALRRKRDDDRGSWRDRNKPKLLLSM